jgi:hypothetical protein
MPSTLGSLARAPRTGRRPAVIGLLALTAALPLVGIGPAAAQSPSPGAPAIPPGTCFLAEPDASPAPPPSLAPGASPLPVRDGTIPAQGGRLVPGQEYVDRSLGPTITFTAGDCWAATPVDAGFGLALVWGGSPAAAVLSLAEFEGLVFEDPCLATSDATLVVDRTPEAIIGDISQSPYLIVSEPIEADLGGLPALRVEVATQSPMGCEPPQTWIWASPSGGGFVLEEGQEATFLFSELNGRTLVAAWETFPGGDFTGLTQAAEALMATLSVDVSTDDYDPTASFPPLPTQPPAEAPSASPDPGEIA